MRNAYLQGIICFESLMATGRRKGYVVNNKPVVCKPNRLVWGSPIATCTFVCHVLPLLLGAGCKGEDGVWPAGA